MFKLIGIIMNMLKSRSFMGEVVSLLSKFGSPEIQRLIATGAKLKKMNAAMIRALDPNQLMNMLTRLPRQQWLNLLEKIKQEDKQAYNKLLQDYEKKETKWTNLSSSWLKKGLYQVSPKNQLVGTLTVLIKSDNSKNGFWYGPYTYPNVPAEVYKNMREASGKNGSRDNPIGAGSIFWRYFLDEWLPSAIRQYVKAKLYKDYHISQGKKSYRATRVDNRQLQKTLVGIKKYGRNYYRTKSAKLMPSIGGIDSSQYMTTRKTFATNLKAQLLNETQSNIIKIYEASKLAKKWSHPVKQGTKQAKRAIKKKIRKENKKWKKN